MSKLYHIIPILISGIFLLCDQLLKHVARTHPNAVFYYIPRLLGWESYKNTGVAFGVPFPSFLIILITPLILAGMVIFFQRARNKTLIFYYGISLIFAGALSNFIDRIAFGATIDYIRIATGIINIADVMIVIGVAMIMIKKIKSN